MFTQDEISRDDVIEMARRAGFEVLTPHEWVGYTNSLEAFAKLVADKEREECALLAATPVGTIAKAIRARNAQECCGNPFKCKGNCVDKETP